MPGNLQQVERRFSVAMKRLWFAFIPAGGGGHHEGFGFYSVVVMQHSSTCTGLSEDDPQAMAFSRVSADHWCQRDSHERLGTEVFESSGGPF
jgi:hypothetical protein